MNNLNTYIYIYAYLHLTVTKIQTAPWVLIKRGTKKNGSWKEDHKATSLGFPKHYHARRVRALHVTTRTCCGRLDQLLVKMQQKHSPKSMSRQCLAHTAPKARASVSPLAEVRVPHS